MHRLFRYAFACQIERAAITRLRGFARPVLRMNGPDPRFFSSRADRQMIADGDLAGKHRASDDRTRALQREGTIHGQTKTSVRLPLANRMGLRLQHGSEIVDPGTGHGGNRQNGNIDKPRQRQFVADSGGFHFRKAVGRGKVGFGNDGNTAPDAEQIDDCQMFAGLRHDAVIGGDNQHDEIDARRPGQHRMHELLVPRHVDKAQYILFVAGQRQIGKAEIDGNAPRLFLFQPVRIHLCKRAHQRGLAMVDMPRRSNDHGCSSSALRAASMKGAASALPPVLARCR